MNHKSNVILSFIVAIFSIILLDLTTTSKDKNQVIAWVTMASVVFSMCYLIGKD